MTPPRKAEPEFVIDDNYGRQILEAIEWHNREVPAIEKDIAKIRGEFSEHLRREDERFDLLLDTQKDTANSLSKISGTVTAIENKLVDEKTVVKIIDNHWAKKENYRLKDELKKRDNSQMVMVPTPRDGVRSVNYNFEKKRTPEPFRVPDSVNKKVFGMSDWRNIIRIIGYILAVAGAGGAGMLVSNNNEQQKADINDD